MKILSIVPTYFPHIGGIEQVVKELALRVAAMGVEMDVAHVAPGLRSATEVLDGLTVHRVRLNGHRLAGLAPTLAAVARPYDLLHVHDPQLIAITTNVRLFCAAKPAVLSTHGGFWHTQQHRTFKRLYEKTLLRGALAHYRRVLATSAGDLSYYQPLADRVSLCSNGVDVRKFGAMPAAAGRSPLRWIYWGRLSRNKRVDLVIEQVATARQLGFDVDLLICGRDADGLLGGLQQQVRSLGLASAVRFEPFVSDALLQRELASRGVYLTASEHEGFGLSVVEAMAAGLVVVCRDMPPLNSFFKHGESGWHLAFDGSAGDGLTLQRLLSLAAPAVERLASAARAAASVHDWDIAARRFVDHYHEALAVESPSRGDSRRTAA